MFDGVLVHGKVAIFSFHWSRARLNNSPVFLIARKVYWIVLLSEMGSPPASIYSTQSSILLNNISINVAWSHGCFIKFLLHSRSHSVTVAYVELMWSRSALGVTLVNPVTSLLNDAIYMSSMLSVMRFLSAVRAALYDTHLAFSPSCALFHRCLVH